MQKETIIDTELATLWYYPKEKIVHHKFHKYIYGDALHQILEAGVDLLIKNRACKWLSDDRNSAAMTKADSEWSAQEWRPKAIKSGWRYWAVIVPRSVTGKMSYNLLAERYKETVVEMKFFEDTKSGLIWLSSLKD